MAVLSKINHKPTATHIGLVLALLCLAQGAGAQCSCESSFDGLKSAASGGGSTSVTVDGKIACENLKTEGTLNAKSDTLTNRYYHFTELGTHNFGTTDKRHYINGTPVTGSNVNLNNITPAPEGGYYLYVGSSGTTVTFTVSGGTNCYLEPVEPEPEPELPLRVVDITWKAPQLGSYGYVKNEKLEAVAKIKDSNDKDYNRPCEITYSTSNSTSIKLPQKGFAAGEVKATVVSCGEYAIDTTINLPAVAAPANCSSCEYYFSNINFTNQNSYGNVDNAEDACERIVGEANLSAVGDGSIEGRAYHFTDVTTMNLGSTSDRYYINGKSYSGNQSVATVKNIPQAPEGGWYMYLGRGSSGGTAVTVDVSGGENYCAVPGGSIPSANNLVIGSVYFSNDSQSAVTHSFVEIYNPTDNEISLTENGGYSLHYKNSSSEWYKLNLKGSIPAKHSFLVNMGKTGSVPVSFSQFDYKAGRLDLIGKFDKSFQDIINNKIQHSGAIKVVLTVGNDHLTDNDEDYLDLVTITADLAKGRVRKRAADGKPDALLSIDFATLDLTKTICLPRNSNNDLWSETLTNAKDCPAFAESSAFETIGLQPGSDATGVNFNWYSSNATGNKASFVRIMSENGNPIKKEGNYYDAPTTTANKLSHRVSVTHLQQGTHYKYQISNDGINWGPVYNYETVPIGPFKFAAVSDAQLDGKTQAANTGASAVPNAQNWKNIVGKLNNQGVNFIVHTGDQVDATSGIDKVNNEYGDFFAPPELRSLPFAPLMGNHDSHCEFIYRYNLPNEDGWPTSCSGNSGYEMNAGNNDGRFNAGNYYYLYNNILFVGLNTAYYPKDKEGARPFVKKYDEVIKAAKNKYGGEYQFIIVNHHKSTQTVSSHAADSDVEAYVQAGLERIMTENGVSLVLSGHDHINVRSKFLVWDETLQKSVPNEPTPHPDSEKHPCKVNPADPCGPFGGDSTGTVYLTLSTVSGMKYYGAYANGASQGGNNANISTFPYLVNGTTGKSNLSDKNPLLGMEKYQDTKQPEYTIVDVNDGVMTLKTYRNNDDLPIDEFVITTSNIPNPSSSSQEEPPPSSSSQEEPPPSSSSQEEPPPSSSSQEEPPPSSSSQEEPPPSSSSQEEPPPSSSSQEEPPPSSSSQEEPPPSSSSQEESPPSSSSQEEPPSSSSQEEPLPSSSSHEEPLPPPPSSSSQEPPSSSSQKRSSSSQKSLSSSSYEPPPSSSSQKPSSSSSQKPSSSSSYEPPSSSSQKPPSSSSLKPSSSSQKLPSSSSQEEPPPSSSSQEELPLYSSSQEEPPPSSSSQEELPLYSSSQEPSSVLPQIASGNLLTQISNGINLTAKTNTTITIYNLSAKLISRQEYLAGNHSISLGYLPKGVYIVKASHGSEKQILRVPVR
jgi:hypothetical protein